MRAKSIFNLIVKKTKSCHKIPLKGNMAKGMDKKMIFSRNTNRLDYTKKKESKLVGRVL